LACLSSKLEGVSYTIHHGCPPGSVRLQGLLPWDIDADLFVVGKGPGFRAKVAAALDQSGLVVEERWADRYFVIRPALSLFGRVLPLFPLVEVDLLQESRNDLGQTLYDQHASHRRWDAGEPLPLRRYKFYESWLAGPYDPEPVLERLYQGAGSVSAISRFRRARLPSETEKFWKDARPFEGEPDWPAISHRAARLRRVILWRRLLCAPWYLLNGLYCLLVQALRRRAGGHIE